jgi:hypothetical protein
VRALAEQLDLLRPYAFEAMRAYRVSTAVNNVKNIGRSASSLRVIVNEKPRRGTETRRGYRLVPSTRGCDDH